MILRFALLLTDKDPMNPENAKREMEQKQQNKTPKPRKYENLLITINILEYSLMRVIHI